MSVSSEWQDLLGLIPGFDPFHRANDTYHFDEEAAQLAVDFFPECLRFIEGEKAGEPFHLEDWQASIVANLFGWKDEDGLRRFREVFLYVPRKNGKTPFVAGISLLMAYVDQEPGGQLYCAASSRDQATLLFRHASGMVQRDPDLAERAKVYKGFKSIEFNHSGAILKVLASRANALHGLSANFVAVDELHAHKDSELLDVLTTSTGARREPLIISLTTADYMRESPCNRKYNYACKVRDQELDDPSFFPIIYEAPEDADWTDPEVWRAANPNLGVSVREEYLARECRRAEAEPSYQNTFRRLHLNQRTGQSQAWLPVKKWNELARELPDLTGIPAYAGLDLSTTTDLSAFVLAFPLEDDEIFLLPRFWIPSAKLTDSEDRLPYEVWAREGHIEVTPGDVVDYGFILRDIVELGETYGIREIRFDPWNATQLATQLGEEYGFEMAQMRQGFRSMNEPSKEFERRISGGTISHNGNPVLTSNVGSAAVKLDPAGNIKPDKSASEERIDGVVASIMALSGAMAAVEEQEIFFDMISY